MHDEDIVKLVRTYEKDVSQGEALLAERPELLNARTELGETPLHLLCLGKSVAAIRAVLDHGAEINSLNACGGSPLSDAALIGHELVVQTLLERGALLSIPGQETLTLHQAVRSVTVRVVELVLDAGAHVDERGPLSETALHLSVQDDSVDIAALLVARGADRHAVNGFNESVVDVAIDRQSMRCLDLLGELD